MMTGSISGISYAVIADELKITIKQIIAAKKDGCKTFEDLIKYYKL